MKQWQSDNNQCTMAKGKFILIYCCTGNTAQEKLNADQISNVHELLFYYPSQNLLQRGCIITQCLYMNVLVYKSLWERLKKKKPLALTINNLCILLNHFNTCKSNTMEFKVISELFLKISQIIKDIQL